MKMTIKFEINLKNREIKENLILKLKKFNLLFDYFMHFCSIVSLKLRENEISSLSNIKIL